MDDTIQTAVHNDLKGQMFRRKRQMPDAEASEFLHGRMIAHVGTANAARVCATELRSWELLTPRRQDYRHDVPP